MTPDAETMKKLVQILRDEDKDAAFKFCEDLAMGGSAEPAPGDPTAAAKDPDPEAEAMTALARDVVARTGAKSAGEAATRAKSIFDAHEETLKRAQTLGASERRSLVAELVKLDVETPDSAWQRDATGEIPEGDARVPVKRLADEPIAELRARVSDIVKRRGVVRKNTPPVSEHSDPNARPLSREAKAYCKKHNLTEAEFRARRVSAVRRST